MMKGGKCVDYVKTMHDIEATTNLDTLESIVNEAKKSSLPIEQKSVVIGFAQSSINYNTVKQHTQADSAERDILAKALDIYRFFEHDL